MAKKIPVIECSARSFKLAFPPETGVDIEAVNKEILDSVQAKGIEAVMAYAEGGRAVTMLELAENGFSEDLPEDGTEVVKVLTFDFKDGGLTVKAGETSYPLARMKLTIGYKRNGTKKAGKGKEPRKDYVSDVFLVTKSAEAADATKFS